MEIRKNTYGRLYTKNWVEFDLVEKGPAVFQFGDDKVDVQPGSLVFINRHQQYTVSAPINRCQIPLTYFDKNPYFDSNILRDIHPSYARVSPVAQPGRAVILGIRTVQDLQDKENASLTYLEQGIIYSTLETFQLFLRDSASKHTASKTQS